MVDRNEMRQRLLAKRAELEERVNRIDVGLHRREEPFSADFAEQVTERENVDVLQSLEDEGRAELALIKRALARLDQHEYGQCTKCGADIAEARLAALPHAEHCMDCAD